MIYRKDLEVDLTPDQVDANFKELSDNLPFLSRRVTAIYPLPAHTGLHATNDFDFFKCSFPPNTTSTIYSDITVTIKLLNGFGNPDGDCFTNLYYEEVFQLSVAADGSMSMDNNSHNLKCTLDANSRTATFHYNVGTNYTDFFVVDALVEGSTFTVLPPSSPLSIV